MKANNFLVNILPNGNVELIIISDKITIYLIKKDVIDFLENNKFIKEVLYDYRI